MFINFAMREIKSREVNLKCKSDVFNFHLNRIYVYFIKCN